MNFDEFIAKIKSYVECEDYQGDISKATFEIDDTNTDWYKGKVGKHISFEVWFDSPVQMANYEKKQLMQKLELEAKERIRKQVYGE